MSELLESVRRSFHHDILSFSDAEARLEGKERKSDVKSGMFLISYVKIVLCPTFSPREKMGSTSYKL